MSIERLRNFASTILDMETTLKEERYRKRKRGAPTDEPSEFDEGPGRGDLLKDASGYLAEERPDYDR
jgi:hypothetical protein